MSFDRMTHENKLAGVAAREGNAKWEQALKRESELYSHDLDIRSEFYRDYTRILHSQAYRRLKHKTQVFFSPSNDHICTRIEHVNHVESVSYTIAKFLGLNTELATTIALGHDLGHAPFGHEGEKILSEISCIETDQSFWHEKNSLHFVDDIETLADHDGFERNMDLTYGVRDGIVMHCGEVDQEKGIHPRDEVLDLREVKKGKHESFTWEGCVMKIADKISYLGRDIEDALTLGILEPGVIKDKLDGVFEVNVNGTVNNSKLIHEFIINICENSSEEKGIALSPEYFDKMRRVKEFNYREIYFSERKAVYKEYIELVIKTIYGYLSDRSHVKDDNDRYTEFFINWLKKYSDMGHRDKKYKNRMIYRTDDAGDYKRAVIDFISGMTDKFAMDYYDHLIRF